MPARRPSRKDQLRTALKEAELSHEEFAEQLGVSYQHLYLVVRGKRQSPRVLEAVELLIAKHLPVPQDGAA